MNVLITGCSRHSKGIVDNLKNNEDKLPVKVIGVDYNPMNILRDGVDAYYIVPAVTDPKYIDVLTDICIENEVDVILPYITSELELMANSVEHFEKHGIKVSVSSPESLKIANDKIELHKLFGHLMPKQRIGYYANDVIEFAKEVNYPITPICSKLSDRCGGAGFAIVDEFKAKDVSLFNKQWVNRYISLSNLIEITESSDLKIILQEYIQGHDYSVVVLCDGKRVIQKCGFIGYKMEFGAVVTGEIVHNQRAYEIVDEIVSKIGLEGNACFDFILKPDKSVVLLEVNPRLSATLPFITEAGINMPYLRCKQLLGADVSKQYEIKYGLKMNKYYVSQYYV